MSRRRTWRIAIFAVVVGLLLAARGPAHEVPNAQFTEGNDQPTGWTLSGGTGRWVDRQLLEVTGSGEDANEWRCPVPVQPGGLYRFEVRARRVSGEGTAACGPASANCDFTPSGDWRWYSFVVRIPDDISQETLRLGQWHAAGTLQFDAVRFKPVVAVHRRVGDLLLGKGEAIVDGLYRFQGQLDRPGGDCHRPLVSATVPFNTNRWCFGNDAQVTYRFEVPGHRFLTAEAAFVVNELWSGVAIAEVSRDGQQWLPLMTQDRKAEARSMFPEAFFPADVLWLRIRAPHDKAAFQINRFSFEAKLSDPPADARGATLFAEQQSTSRQLKLEQLMPQEDHPGQPRALMTVRNVGDRDAAVTLSATMEMPDGSQKELHSEVLQVPQGKVAAWGVALSSEQPGDNQVTLRLQPDQGEPLQYRFPFQIPDFHRADYGRLLSQAAGTSVWWCDATHKVSRQRPAPRERSQAVELSAARNDYEAVQVVVQPQQPLKGLRAACSPLKRVGAAGAIAAEEVQILRVYYHHVKDPVDRTSVADWWPDALPPLAEPLDVAAGENQPLWVLVHVPTGAAAGDYTGEVALQAEGWSMTVPLRLHVWNFALPEKNHLETAFGFDHTMAFRYHQVTTEEDKRKLLDLYLRSFAEHRISVYDPTPLDPIRVKFVPEASPPRAEVDFTAFDRAMTEAVERCHFTNFRLLIQGMGGGTFHDRVEPAIGKFGEQTPQYQAMFSSQAQQIQEHLRQKGWLSMAYVYWFDEPDPKDYPFVRNGMERLKQYAPAIQTMLTEEPNEALGRAVDIFCPLTPAYLPREAEKLRAQGTRFWWYVCTAPKAPYCTEFLDHPASDLRVWHWQTWQQKVVGTLVWHSNYWTSECAYPDQPQNPYEDPQCYVSGYSTPKGAKRFWGNGDGRFIYPPLAAAVPGASCASPVLEPPVSSIRWEMLREGVEDYEFLYLLRERLQSQRAKLSAEQIRHYETLLEVPESIAKDMTTFTTDPAPIYERRAAVAAAIEELE